MGKMKNVLSRRILWFKRQRMTTAAAIAAIAASAACADDVLQPTSEVDASASNSDPPSLLAADGSTLDFSSVGWELRANGSTRRYHPESIPDSRVSDIYVWERPVGTGLVRIESGTNLVGFTFNAVGKSWTLAARRDFYVADVTVADMSAFASYAPPVCEPPIPYDVSATVTRPRSRTEVSWEAADGCHTGYNIHVSNTADFSDQKTEYQRNLPSQKSVSINHSLNGGWSAEATTLYYRVLSTARGSSNPPRSEWSEVLAVIHPTVRNEPPEATGPGFYRSVEPVLEGDILAYNLAKPDGLDRQRIYYSVMRREGIRDQVTSASSSYYIDPETTATDIVEFGADRIKQLQLYIVDDTKVEAVRDTIFVEFRDTWNPGSATWRWRDTVVIHEGVCDRTRRIAEQVLFWSGVRNPLSFFEGDLESLLSG